MQFGTSVRNARADAVETTIGAAAKLYLFSGAKPTNCAAADPAGELASGALPSDWLAAASSGSKALAGTWIITAAANGDVASFRIKDNAGTTCHIQGTVTQFYDDWQGTTAYTAGDRVTNNGRIYEAASSGTSASSGGPTGTGTGISDGSVTWDFVSAVGDMTISNVTVAIGQDVEVTEFEWTEGNA